MKEDCKICNSEHKDAIEKMILDGLSNNLVAENGKVLGITLTHAGVNRHKTRHMPEHSEKIKAISTPKYNQKYGVKEISVKVCDNDIVDMANSYRDKLKPDDDLKEAILNDTLLKQMALVRVLQEKYINGECRFPYEEIKALDCLISARNRYIGIMEKEKKMQVAKEENPFVAIDRLRNKFK